MAVLVLFFSHAPLEAFLPVGKASTFPHPDVGILPPGTGVCLRDMAPPLPGNRIDTSPLPVVVVEALPPVKIAA